MGRKAPQQPRRIAHRGVIYRKCRSYYSTYYKQREFIFSYRRVKGRMVKNPWFKVWLVDRDPETVRTRTRWSDPYMRKRTECDCIHCGKIATTSTPCCSHPISTYEARCDECESVMWLDSDPYEHWVCDYCQEQEAREKGWYW